MDITTLLEERLLQFCVYVGTHNDERYQCIPFCAAQTWSALDAMKIGSSPDPTHCELSPDRTHQQHTVIRHLSH
jgi:hypothetical protein